MKLAIFGVLALCLVLTNAGTIDPVGQAIKTMEGFSSSLVDMAEGVVNSVENKYDEIVVQPLQRVEESVMAIEQLKEHSEVCVSEYDVEVENAVKLMEDSLNKCAATAALETADVGAEIGKLTVTIAYDTIDLVSNYRRCQKYTSPILSKPCFARVTVKATLLLVKTKRAISLVNKSVDETLPQIYNDLEGCSAAAEATVLSELSAIHESIDSCIVTA